jgi:DNA-binding NarL/FixJ family response regulator
MLKTLVVDDSEDFRQSLVEELYKRFPYMVITQAICGQDAKQKMNTATPDLIFMDIRLPDGNGLEVCKQIKIRYPDIDIVVMSSFNLPEYRNAAVKTGAIYFLAKETLCDSIHHLFNNVLSQRHSTSIG